MSFKKYLFIIFFLGLAKFGISQSLVVSTNTTITAAQFLTYTSYTIQPGVTLSVTGAVTITSGISITDNGLLAFSSSLAIQNSGASLSVIGTGSMSIAGNVTVNGTPFTDNVPTTVGGNFTEQNSGASFTTNSSLAITGALTVNGTPFTVTSTATVTAASLSLLNGGGSIVDNGHISISGNANTNGDPISGTGSLYTGGTISATNGGASIFGSTASCSNCTYGPGGYTNAPATYTAQASTNWTVTTTWNPNGTPTATDNVLIPNGYTVAVSSNQSINNANLTGNGGINFVSTKTLTIGGALSLNGTSIVTGTVTGFVNAATFSVAPTSTATIGRLTMAVSGASEIDGKLIFNNGTGTSTHTGDVTFGADGQFYFSAAKAVTLSGNLIIPSGGIIDGSVSPTGTVTVAGNCTIGTSGGTGMVTVGEVQFTSTAGTTNIYGNIAFTNAIGTKSFKNITINSGGTWDASAVDQTYNIVVGNLTNNGTLKAGATTSTIYNFTGTSQVNGTLAIPTFSVQSGITTNNATLTISNQLSGAGSFTQGATGYLYYSASSNIAVTTFIASAASNTVDYTYAGVQNIKKVAYYNLTASTSGTKTLLGTTTVSGNLSVTGTAQLDVDATNNYALNVAGNWNLSSTNVSPFLAEAGTVTFNGTSGTQSLTTTTSQESFYGLTINNTSGSATGVNVDRNTTVNGVFILTSGTLSIGANSLTCLGNVAVNAGGISGTTGIVVCTGSVVTFGTTSGGPTVVPTVSISTSSIAMQRGIYSNAVTVTKNLSTNVIDSWRGGNTFNGVFTLTNAAVGDTSGDDGDIYIGANSGDPVDVFNANSYFFLTGAARIRVPQYGTAVFNAPAHFYSQGISPHIAANGHDRIQPARFSPAAVTFNDSALFYCNSLTTDMHIAYDPGTTVTFNKPVVATHSGTSAANFYFGYSGTVNFNDDVYFNNTGSGTINIVGQANGAATLASGKKISVGAKGFSSGSLTVWNLTQLGTSATQSITLTGTAIMNVGGNGTPCTFNAPVNFSSPNINLTQNTFNGATNLFAKTGTVTQTCYGGNTFSEGTLTSFSTTNTGYWRLAGTAADIYNGDVIFNQTGSGALGPNYSTNCSYAGDVTFNSPSYTITAGASTTGIMTLAGTGTQSISLTAGGTPIITNLTISNIGSGVTLATPVYVAKTMAFNNGLLNTTATNLLTLKSGATVTTALSTTATSYVNGPMNCQLATGTQTTLNFPVGTSGDCRPISLVAKNANSNLYNYTTKLFNGNAFSAGTYTNYPATVDTLSGVHYWQIARTNSVSVASPTLEVSGAQQATLYFDTDDQVYNGSLLTVCKTYTNSTDWVDIGKSSTTIGTSQSSTPLAGSITSSTSGPTAFNSFSYFTLGRLLGSGSNPLPIELLSFSAVADGEKVDIKWETVTETNNSYFSIEKSKDGKIFTKVIAVPGAGNSNAYREYAETDYQPYGGQSYYRLKQTDFNGNYKYFNVVSIDFSIQKNILLYPNPIDHTSNLNIQVKGYQDEEVVVVLRDVQGREFLSKVLVSEEDYQLFIVDETKSLTPGTYIVTASSNDKTYNYKLIVK